MDNLFDARTIVALLIGVAGLVMIIVGIQVVGGSRRAQYSETMRTGFNATIGIVLIAIGATAGVLALLGGRILDLLGWT